MINLLQRLWPYRWVVGVACILLCGGAAWWMYKGGTAETTTPRIGPAVQAVYTTGNVEATQTIPLAPKTGGWLSALHADESDAVAEGTVLATLDASDLTASVAQLRAKERYAQDNLQRLTQLAGTPAGNPDALALARSNALAATAARKQAEAQLGFTKLVAPVSGTVVQRDGEPGAFIPAGTPVFYLAAGPLRITTQVDEEDIPHITPGLPVLIRVEAMPDHPVSGTVVSITPRGDATARTFRVRIALPDDPSLKIGMTAEVNIILSQADNALLVPNGAVKNGQVWVIERGEAVARPVTVGAVGISETQITSGITAEDRIVVAPAEETTSKRRMRFRL